MKSVLSSVLATTCALSLGCAGVTAEDTSRVESEVSAPSSAYTTLAADDCRTVASGDEGGAWSRQICPGMPGWSLLVEDGDARMNVQVRFGDRAMDLGVWNRLTAFSHLGPKAEWRGAVKSPGVVDPYAVIFRYFQTDGEGREKSYLVVSRITKTASCIVGLVDGGEANGNGEARELADAARTFVCPTTEAPPLPSSIFTTLDDCPFTQTFEDGSGHYDCPGAGGYAIEKQLGDLRENVVLHTPGGAKVDLAVWRLGQGGFSHIGPTADWRVHGPEKKPHALMFRRKEQLDETGRESNWLVVVKLAGNHACLYDVIDAKQHPDANELAHAAMDESFANACPANPPSAH